MTQLIRPEPPAFAARDGHAWQPWVDPGWRLATAAEHATRRCRRWRLGCTRPVVAALNRGRWTSTRGRVDSWWLYCAGHLYGRWIEDGQVMAWRAVRVAS